MTEIKLPPSIELITKERIEHLFKEHYAVLTAYANKFMNDLDDSKEVVQNVFVNLLDSKKSIKIHTSVKAHLYTSVRNACLNAIRQKATHDKHHENIKYLSKDSDISTDEVFEQSELEYQIYQAIDELPEQCKRIFKMNRLEGLTNQEIADHLGISKRTVETQISKALKNLRKKISPTLCCLLVFYIFSDIKF